MCVAAALTFFFFWSAPLSCFLFSPNDGFMTQLNLYGDIEYDVDVNRTAYRRFLIASMAAQRESKLIPLLIFVHSHQTYTYLPFFLLV